MMPRISPSRTAKLTSCTAFSPPKLFDRPRTSSSTGALAGGAVRAGAAAMVGAGATTSAALASGVTWLGGRSGSGAPLQYVPHLPVDALGRGQDDQDDGRTQHHALDARELVAELGLQDLGERDEDRRSR